MGVRDFLRGGIYDAEYPVTVMRNNVELGTWYPKGQGVTATYYGSSNTISAGTPGTVMTSSSSLLRGSGSGEAVDVDSIRDAVAQLNNYLNPPKEKNG